VVDARSRRRSEGCEDRQNSGTEKVSISPVNEAVRIRTEETGEKAV